MNLTSYKQLFNLEDKQALVIGAGSGIGEASALGLAAFGANVACADLNQESVEAVAASITSQGGSAKAYSANLLEQASLNELVNSLPKLDILVCTPSINVRKPLLEYSEAEFDMVVSLNLKGSFFAMQAAGRRMAEQQSGSIILFSSIRSQVVEPGQGVYAATKAGTLQMVRALAAELGDKKVRVNAIAPGVVETPLTAQIKAQPDWYNAYAKKGALGRWAQPS